MAKKKNDDSFEMLLEETEAMVEALEEGELSLDESLASYEKGVKNLRACSRLLEEAEEKVKVLVEESANLFRLDDLDEDDAESDDMDEDDQL